MSDSWSEDLHTVAHHEAGHAVMALHLGATLVRVGLRRGHECWEGSAPTARPGQLSTETLILTGFAGPWSEVRYRASQEHGQNSRLDEADHCGTIIAFYEATLEDMSTFDSLEASVSLGSRGTATIDIDANTFGGDIDIVAAVASQRKVSIEDVRDFLLESRRLINLDPIWNAISTLAARLIHDLGDGESIEMSGDAVASLVMPILQPCRESG